MKKASEYRLSALLLPASGALRIQRGAWLDEGASPCNAGKGRFSRDSKFLSRFPISLDIHKSSRTQAIVWLVACLNPGQRSFSHCRVSHRDGVIPITVYCATNFL